MAKSTDVLLQALKQIPHVVDTKLPSFLWLALDYMVTTQMLVLASGSCHLSLNTDLQDFPGSPVVKTLCFHCKGHGELRSHVLSTAVKKQR